MRNVAGSQFAYDCWMQRFGPFEVDFSAAELRKSGLRVRIQEQPLRILQVLMENNGKLVSREDLQRRL